MRKILLACFVLIMSGLSAQVSYADPDDIKDMEDALAKLQNSKESGDLWGAVQTFTYKDITKLPPKEQKKVADLIFNIMDGKQKIPEGRIPASDIRETAVRAIGYALYKAEDDKVPSPIPKASERLIKAVSKSPDIADEAFETVLRGSNVGEGNQALKSKPYKELVKIATSDKNEDVRASALANLAEFTEGGEPTRNFVLSRLNADPSPKVKAAALSGLEAVWRLDGEVEVEQKSVQRFLSDSEVQKTLLDGFDTSKKYDSMKDDSSHPILCSTIANYVTFAETGDAVGDDFINNKNLVQPSIGLLQSAKAKLDTAYPDATEIKCPGRDMWGQTGTRVYDTGKLDKAFDELLTELKKGYGPTRTWTISCNKFGPEDSGASLCADPLKNALTDEKVGCEDVEVRCGPAPDAYCKVQSSNCVQASRMCPEKQVRTVFDGKLKMCVAVPGSIPTPQRPDDNRNSTL
jgi:hypothetical protein